MSSLINSSPMKFFLHSFQLLWGEDSPGRDDIKFSRKEKLDRFSTWFALTSADSWSPLSVTRLQRIFQLFIQNLSTSSFHHNMHLHQVYHQHQQCWSLSGMLAMRGHRPILFPRCSPVYILVRSTYKIHCTVHEGALSSWLLIKR